MKLSFSPEVNKYPSIKSRLRRGIDKDRFSAHLSRLNFLNSTIFWFCDTLSGDMMNLVQITFLVWSRGIVGFSSY